MDKFIGKWETPRDLSGWRVIIEDGPRKGVYRAVGNICKAPITPDSPTEGADVEDSDRTKPLINPP